MIRIKNLGIEENTPLAMLTIGQLIEVLKETQMSNTSLAPTSVTERKYVYGLRGIRDLFHVSIRTAQIYKDSILKEAVYQNGRTIVVDAEKALQLFNERRNAYERK